MANPIFKLPGKKGPAGGLGFKRDSKIRLVTDRNRTVQVHQNILALIGKTPIVKLPKIARDVRTEIWAKLENFNPSGSVKDRITWYMVEQAEKRGELKKGGTIVEPTPGNTGIALSMVAAIKGYQMIAVMPGAMSPLRKVIVEFLGAKVELVPSSDGVTGRFTKEDIENTVKRARELLDEIPNSCMLNQFDNPDNPKAHAEATAVEIVEQTRGNFQAFVAACGTGGTFSGVARVLKERCPHVKTVLVEPKESAVNSGCKPGFHKIQGIGEGFIPRVMDITLVDKIVTVSDEDAIKMTHRLAREEGVLTGFSGGANVYASLEMAKELETGQAVLTVIPDSCYRYYSTELFAATSTFV